eukprot:scaffold30433_cov26-Tisochrysis_lutea.AAC.2
MSWQAPPREIRTMRPRRAGGAPPPGWGRAPPQCRSQRDPSEDRSLLAARRQGTPWRCPRRCLPPRGPPPRRNAPAAAASTHRRGHGALRRRRSGERLAAP